MLKIELIGNVKIEKDSQDLTTHFAAKAIALLCLLFIHEKKTMNRSKIIEYLWPDSSEEAGKTNLRYNLWEIKNIIGLDREGQYFLDSNRQTCSINPNYSYFCDFSFVREIDRAADYPIEKWQEAEAIFKGDFMEGYYFKECEELNNMILFERRSLEDQRIKILFHLLDYYTDRGLEDHTMQILRELEKVGPYDEVVAQKIIENYEKMGRRSSGLLFYKNFRSRLSTFFGIQPSEELRASYESLRKREEDSRPSSRAKNPSERSEGQQDQGRDISKEDWIYIESSCIGEIKYFWISDLLEKMSEKKPLAEEIKRIRREKKDLDILDINKDYSDIERPPDMRLAKSFLFLMEDLSQKHRLVLKIKQAHKMDSFSKMILGQIEDSLNITIDKETSP